ncbi:uncharacterized protein LOC123547255 isoform X2 [Mercenaria mercenaria]|uniref:uncharacterized protein LOC123547255 isoform X2 n=1 Tax=Mercenaria mercenaria TaxID=6596 RepID=UPI00234EC371|nr:uncharacterized protein LOC123547255 isoform X2 [Mercenaria mercenaria]
MAVPLQSISSRLQTLSSKLRRDPDIQMQIKCISKNAATTAESFKSALSKEGGNILLQKTLLLTGNSGEANITDLQSALKVGKEALCVTRKNITCIQTNIRNTGDICSTRIAGYESDLSAVLTKISSASAEIDNLWANISTYEDEAAAASSEAFDLQERAAFKKKAAEQARHNANLIGIVGGLVGTALAPFTGGQSLAMASAATNLKESDLEKETDEMEKNASRLYNEAEKYSREARKLKLQKSELKRKRAILDAEMGHIQIGIDSVKDAANVLRQVSSFLLPTFNTMDSLLQAFQDMDTALDDVCQQSNPYDIIKNAFAIHPKTKDGCSQLYLKKVGDKWKQLEALLLQHGVQSL